MKKIFSGLLIAVVLTSVCYGAENDDIYVRRDVFDAKMEAFFERIDKKIDTAVAELKDEMKALSSHVDTLEKCFDFMTKSILIILGALAIGQYINACIELNKSRKERENNEDNSKKYLTLRLTPDEAARFIADEVRRLINEDVRRLIVEEIDLRFSAKSGS